MDTVGRRLLQRNLISVATSAIGYERWDALVMDLIALEEKTGFAVMRQPRAAERRGRGCDETHPLVLFTPEQDRAGRLFVRFEGGEMLYMTDTEDGTSARYPVRGLNELTWWRSLANEHKGVVIGALGYLISSLGEDEGLGDALCDLCAP